MKKKSALAQHILETLAETSADLLRLTVDIMLDPHSIIRMAYGASSRQRTVQLYNLGRSKYFEKKSGSDTEYVLTSYGRAAALRCRVLQKQKHAWDGKYRAIGFDIQEKRRKDRDVLRRELRMLGCIELHQSFWITPHNIIDELLCLLKLWGVEMKGDVRVFIIQDIFWDNDLIKRFRLKPNTKSTITKSSRP